MRLNFSEGFIWLNFVITVRYWQFCSVGFDYDALKLAYALGTLVNFSSDFDLILMYEFNFYSSQEVWA